VRLSGSKEVEVRTIYKEDGLGHCGRGEEKALLDEKIMIIIIWATAIPDPVNLEIDPITILLSLTYLLCRCTLPC
jgi:hypothetical protein